MSNAPVSMYTPETLARMAPSDVNNWISGLPAAQRDAAAALARQAVGLRNQAFLSMTNIRYAPCPALGQTTPFSAAYTGGTNLVFNLPTTVGGILEALTFIADITVNYTPAGTPTIALNAAREYALFESVQLRYGNGIMDYGPPYFHNLVDGLFKGYQKFAVQDINSANANVVTNVQNLAKNGLPIVSGANTWRLIWRIDRNPLHDQAVPGLLPITGSTQATITVRTAQNLIGRDPLLNLFNTNATALTATGQVQVIAEYRDGTSMASVQPLIGPDLSTQPTFQTTMEPPLRLLAPGAYNRQRIVTVGQHYYAIAAVIDAQQSNVFSTVPNLQGFQITRDEGGNDFMYNFGVPSSIPKEMWYYHVRRHLGQDAPEGIIPWVVGNVYNEADPDDRLGRAVLNMVPGQWANLYHGYNPIALNGVAGVNARVETFIGTINPSGLAIVG